MTVDIKKGKAAGTVAAPPSKSMAHRSLICAALTNQSSVSGLEYSVDITATSECLKAMGAVLTKTENGVKIGGLDPRKIPECELYCFESGSTLRFLIPLCLLSNNKITLKGSRRLLERPLSIYAELCKEKAIVVNVTMANSDASMYVALIPLGEKNIFVTHTYSADDWVSDLYFTSAISEMTKNI